VRVVLDTNVLVSGLLCSDGPPARVLRIVRERRYTIVSSDYQIAEFIKVVGRRHLRKRIALEDAKVLIANIEGAGVVLRNLPEIDLSPDPNGNPILATALAGEADPIVTGDKRDLLFLKSVRGIPIMTARDALARLEGL